VTRVVDGDTIWVVMDGRREKIRMLNLDAPEEGRPYSKAAGKHLRKILGTKTVRLLPEKEGTKFSRGDMGRTLAFVILEGKNVNVEMVRAGMARYFTKFGKGRFASAFREAEKEAKAKRRGIWGGRKG
jgi:micrococcal nuclease